jgi:serine/threonine protein kinase
LTDTAYHLTLPAGSRIEEYEIISVLGQGSFGITYLAEDTNLSTRLAIKEYLPGDWAFRDTTQTVRPKNLSVSESFERGQEAFLKEARLIARITHPNIVKVRRFFRAHGTAYIAMDFITGTSLADALNQDYRAGGYPNVALKRLLVSILGGLGAVHEAGIIHRDIKPGNIMIEPGGNPVLVDFGAARNFDASGRQGMTVIVTPGYAPIEQYADDQEQGPYTDIYALGALAFRAITGQPPDAPYKRLTSKNAVTASVAGAGRYPAPLLAAVDWALAVQPQERPQSSAALLERLRDVPEHVAPVIDEPTQIMSDKTRIIETPRRPIAPARREASVTPLEEKSAAPAARVGLPKLVIAAAIVLLLLGGGYVAATSLWGGPKGSTTEADQEAQRQAAETARQAAEAQKATAAKAEAERQAAAAAKLKADQEAAEAARAAVKQEAERQAAAAAKLKAEQDAAEAARVEAERLAAAKAEADRQAAATAKLKADQDAARAEAERQAAAKAEADRQAAAKAEADRQAAAAARLKADQTAADAARKRAEQQAAAPTVRDTQAEKTSPARSVDPRCTKIIQTTQLEGALSDDDRAYLRDHCH